MGYRRRAQTRFKHEQGFWTRRRVLKKSPIPVSVVHHAFLELREERLKLVFGHSHRGCSLQHRRKGKDAERGRSWSERIRVTSATMFRRWRSLPLALFSLILDVADSQQQQQQQQQFNLDTISTFTSASTLTLPSYAGDVVVSIALCGNPEGTTPQAIFTNSSTGTPTEANVNSQDVFEISIEEGLGTWTGPIGQGGQLAITNTGQTTYEVGVSTDPKQAFHQYLGQSGLLFGDSTGEQAIFFSPPFESIPITQSKFPNYTLPTVQMPFPVSQPSSTPQFVLTLVETSLASGLLQRSSCALTATSSEGTVKNQTNWIRNEAEGWRSKWLVEGLSPGTNYSAFVSRDGTEVSGPLYFTTKSGWYASLLRSLVPSQFS